MKKKNLHIYRRYQKRYQKRNTQDLVEYEFYASMRDGLFEIAAIPSNGGYAPSTPPAEQEACACDAQNVLKALMTAALILSLSHLSHLSIIISKVQERLF